MKRLWTFTLLISDVRFVVWFILFSVFVSCGWEHTEGGFSQIFCRTVGTPDILQSPEECPSQGRCSLVRVPEGLWWWETWKELALCWKWNEQFLNQIMPNCVLQDCTFQFFSFLLYHWPLEMDNPEWEHQEIHTVGPILVWPEDSNVLFPYIPICLYLKYKQLFLGDMFLDLLNMLMVELYSCFLASPHNSEAFTFIESFKKL